VSRVPSRGFKKSSHDHISPHLTSQFILLILMLRRSSYESDVAEDTPEQTTVARIHASDADAGENGHVTYRWADQTASTYGSVFGIAAETGEVFLKSRLDYEQQQVYKVRIESTRHQSANYFITVLLSDKYLINFHYKNTLVKRSERRENFISHKTAVVRNRWRKINNNGNQCFNAVGWATGRASGNNISQCSTV